MLPQLYLCCWVQSLVVGWMGGWMDRWERKPDKLGFSFLALWQLRCVTLSKWLNHSVSVFSTTKWIIASLLNIKLNNICKRTLEIITDTEIFFKKKDRLCYCCFNRKVEGKDESDFLHLFQIAVKSIAWAYFQT